MNLAIISGRLGADVDLRKTSGGTSVANLSVATSKKIKDQSGGWKEQTEWHRIVAWGVTADNCAKFLGKGSQIVVRGEIRTRSWEDDSGHKKYTTEIHAQEVQFVGGRNDRQESSAYHAGGHGFAPKTSEGFPQNSGPSDDFPSQTAPDLSNIPF